MWDIYTMEYYSANKNNEMMPFTARWMDLEIILLSEVKISYNIAYIRNLKGND